MKLETGGKIGLAAGGIALAVSFVGAWEGLRLTAYPDRIAGNIPTVCYGETRGVKLGDTYTKAECDTMLAKALVDFESGLDRCMKPPAPLSLQTKVAFVSWAYNVGTGAACKSTLVKMVNRGETRSACDQLLRWTKAGGKAVKGLVNRRNAERELCIAGLNKKSN